MTNFLDLTIVIDPGDGGFYNVRVDSSEGQGKALLKLPPRFSGDGPGLDAPARGIGAVAPDGSSAKPRSAADYGAELFTALFQGEVGDRLVATISRANYMPDTGVRIRLSMDLRMPGMAEVASLPWELMCRPGERAFVVSKKTALVRGLDTPQPLNPMPFLAPLRILLLMSNPASTEALNLESERARIMASWAKLPGVEVDEVRPVRKRILDQLDLHDYHVIHYMGHGDFAADAGGMLIMETEDGQPDLVSADQFAMMLDDEPLRLVFLNACKTGATQGTASVHPYAGVAAALIRERIPAVVAMQFPISDGAAIAFAETFYQRIADGKPVDVAVAEGRKVIYSDQHAEWATPVLYMRSSDGNLFTPADARPAASAAAPLPLMTNPASTTVDDWGAETGDRLKLLLATPDQDREKLHQQLAATLGARDDCAVFDNIAIDAASYGATVDSLLRGADLCIHLLGANPGRRIDVDDDQPLRTYTLQQLDAGRKLAKSQLVLITPEDRASIGNAAYKALIDEIEAMPRDKARFEFVVADRNRVVDAITAKLEEIARARHAAQAPAGGAGSTAFVDAHEIDSDRAIDLMGFLEGRDVSTAINTGKDDVRDPALLDETIRHTGLYVIVAGKVNPEWVRNRKLAIVKSAARTRSRVLVAKYPTATAPDTAPRVEISSFNDSDRSWVDALFADDGVPRP